MLDPAPGEAKQMKQTRSAAATKTINDVAGVFAPTAHVAPFTTERLTLRMFSRRTHARASTVAAPALENHAVVHAVITSG